MRLQAAVTSQFNTFNLRPQNPSWEDVDPLMRMRR